MKDYKPVKANELLVNDITHVESTEGMHYLSSVTDAFTRQIKGYKLSQDMKAEDAVQTFKMVMKQPIDQATMMIHHSN